MCVRVCSVNAPFLMSLEWGGEKFVARTDLKVQAVIRRPLTAEARFQIKASPCGTSGGQSGTGTSFSLSISLLHSRDHSTIAPH
jgi:hypothetical protein